MNDALWALAGAGVGALVAVAFQGPALRSPPPWSLRRNVSGNQVPAVLGGGVVLGGVAGGVAAALGAGSAGPWRGEIAAGVAFLALAAAGLWDDRRGDEAPRGFRGHLGARRLTGGLVKIAAGGLAGIAAGALLYRDHVAMAALTALAVPLAANLFNLLDRAPGRTGKAALLVGIPLLALGDEHWALSAAGSFGALAAVLPADLGERGMLGDAGANAVGALIGLGLAVSLGTGALAATVALLLALNAASERWSFSQVIERTLVLRAFDRFGRK